MTRNPIDTVEWVDPALLHANDYNPNRVAKTEMELLRISIVEDGWTQPIVARDDGEIVDGFHRWTLGRDDPDVRALHPDGCVPVVRLNPSDEAHQRMSTIRHNRARGSHYVLRMSEIIVDLETSGLDDEEIGRRLGMEHEEVRRLSERGNMILRAAQEEFGNAWVPTIPGAEDDDA